MIALWFIATAPALQQMEQAYRMSEFESVLALAQKAERDARAWPPDEQKRRHELTAFAHLFLDDLGNAEKELRQVFLFDPGYSVDRKKQPPSVVELVESVQKKLRAEQAPPPQVASAPVVTERPAPPPPHFNPLSLIPFGIGQLALGDYVAGAIFLVLDAGLFAANLALYFVRLRDRSPGDEYTDAQRAMNMQIAQNVSAGALAACVVIGFIDALAWSPSRVAKKQNVTVAPTPGGVTVFGAF